MRYRILESGMVRGGSLEIILTEVGDTYTVDYSCEIKLGKKVFGKWIPLPGFSKSGSARVAKKYLSEAFIGENSDFETNDIRFTKVSRGEVLVDGTGFTGNVFVSFDGMDPVEIDRIKLNTMGYELEAV